MATITLDVNGLKCPQPVLKIASKIPEISAGDVLEVKADCPTFEKDVRAFCERVKKPLLWFRQQGSGYVCQIQF